MTHLTQHCTSRGCLALAPYGMKAGDGSYRWACAKHLELIGFAPPSSPGGSARGGAGGQARPSDHQQGSLFGGHHGG